MEMIALLANSNRAIREMIARSSLVAESPSDLYVCHKLVKVVVRADLDGPVNSSSYLFVRDSGDSSFKCFVCACLEIEDEKSGKYEIAATRHGAWSLS